MDSRGLVAFLQDANLSDLIRPLTDAKEDLATLEERLLTEGRPSLMQHLATIPLWTARDGRGIKIPVAHRAALCNSLVRLQGPNEVECASAAPPANPHVPAIEVVAEKRGPHESHDVLEAPCVQVNETVSSRDALLSREAGEDGASGVQHEEAIRD